ncbi:MAG TPA: hypothetical protein VJZ49_12090 [Syntrophales bacterium]|nr:hypothetical protein [Syntrophales bacterium]
MFGVTKFEPWKGPAYGNGTTNLLVLGESRFDEDFTDRKIIEYLIGGNKHRTFTNFVQAALSKRYWEEGYDPFVFWDKVLFYNYLTTFYPGEARVPPSSDQREDPQNRKILRSVLQKYKPSHCIVWGCENWDTIAVEGECWSPEWPIPGLADPHNYRSVVVDNHPTLFSYINHPSSIGFSFERWGAVIAAFVALRT